jgi:Methylamine utilisation protein MauE
MKHFLRIILALVLLSTGGAKLADTAGFAAVLHSYRFFPSNLIWPVAITVIVAELVIAVWLIWGQFLLRAAQASIALHGCYACWSVYMLLRGKPIFNCGCFGSIFARPLSWMTVVEDLVMVSLSAALYHLCRTSALMPEPKDPGS